MTLASPLRSRLRRVITIHLLAMAVPHVASSQEPKVRLEKPAEPATSESPFTIEKLETRVRFEADGASRREVHAVIRINSETGARQFARLNFDYNRAVEQIEIPLLRIVHANGGTTEVLPGAIADQPNPAVVDAPAYHDVRRKSARILGLQSGDTLEYRITTAVSHHPLAPDFYFTHSFSHGAGVAAESLEIDLPASRQVHMRILPAVPPPVTEKSGEGADARIHYRWDHPKAEWGASVALSTFGTWEGLSIKLAERLTPGATPLESIKTYEESVAELSEKPEITEKTRAKALELTKSAHTDRQMLEAIYDFVAQKIATIDLPLGSTAFAPRRPEEILASGYAAQEDKFVLFAALSSAVKIRVHAALTGFCDRKGLPIPSVFNHLLVYAHAGKTDFWLDPSLEVAPFGVISPSSKKCAFVLAREFSVMSSTGHEWQVLSVNLPFAATQRVRVTASVAVDGKLTAHVKYALRGDNELLLRIAFHRAPREQWKGLAQLLSLADGFRGEVSNVAASDPLATRHPFRVEYEIAQTSFVNWSKAPVRLPIPLPTLGLPEAPANAASSNSQPIDLGTPLEVEAQVTLRLPPGTIAGAPVPTTVRRDYAEFASTYSVRAGALTASRRLKFLLREIPAERAADYAAFVHAVQNDEAQEFTLERAKVTRAPSRPAAPRKPSGTPPT